jgi:ABC-type multidrug transport system permease subunit
MRPALRRSFRKQRCNSGSSAWPAQPGQVHAAARAWFNGSLEGRNYFVPGVIAILITLVSLLLTGLAVAREKEIGTMEQIMVTPITPVEFILGKNRCPSSSSVSST